MRNYALVAGMVVFCLTGSAQAEQSYERLLERQVERLRMENERLYVENTRLKEQLGRRQYNRPYSYGSATGGPLRQGTQQLRDLEALKRSWENLQR